MNDKLAVLNKQTRDILEREFEKRYILDRPGRGGQTLKYVEGANVIKRLNNAFDHNWSYIPEVVSIDDKFIIMRGTLTVGEITKCQFGSQEIKHYKNDGGLMDLGYDYKAAATDALKKCATLFGIALHLYGDLEPSTRKKEPATDAPFFDSRYEEKGTVPQNHQQMLQNSSNIDPRDRTEECPDEELRDIAQPQIDLSTEEETTEPSEKPEIDNEPRFPDTTSQGERDKKACFAIADKLGITDELIKQECLETFWLWDGGIVTESNITSRTQMNPEQWKTYRDILEQRQEFRKFHGTYVASGIPIEDLDTYLCIRFTLPSIRLLERYRCDDVIKMLEQSIEKNKMDKFTAAVASVNTWINRKSIGRTGAFNLLENLYRLSVELDDPELSYQVVKEFYKNMKIMKEDPRLSNILASLFPTWQEALKKACSAHSVNFDVIIEPDLEATEDMQTEPEADDDMEY